MVSFTVRSAYYLAKSLEVRGRPSGSSEGNMTEFWKTVWNVQGPPVVKLFLWKACRDALATRENLHRRKIIFDPCCPICGLETETVGHILWSCGSAQDVWLESTKKLQKSTSAATDFIEIFRELTRKLDPNEIKLFAVIARQLWLRRNTYVFGGPLTAPAVLICQAKDQLDAFERAEAGRSLGRDIARKNLISVTWNKPPVGFLKINWDASVDVSQKRMGMGIAIWDHDGVLLAAFCATRDFTTEPATAEALTAWQAVELSRCLGLLRVVLEGDALEFVKLKNEETWLGSYGHVLQDAKQKLRQCMEWKVTHVHRQGDSVAHCLAKLALNVQHEILWTDNFPLCIWDLVNNEQGSS